MPVSGAWVVPSGVSTPWLMALLRNSTLAGSMKIDVKRQQVVVDQEVDGVAGGPVNADTIGPMPKKPKIARIRPRMPAEKLSTSISKPGLILPSQIASSFFISQPPSGPMIIAPRNIGTSAPAITPMVAIAPTTPPRMP